MPLKKAKGQMYDWVTHTHSLLKGKCSHECGYCYVQAMAKRFPNVKNRYGDGKIELVENELLVDYGKDKLIFIEHMNDLFAKDVPSDIILAVLDHCREYPHSNYVFQTKNPQRYAEFYSALPDDSILGTTIESNRVYDIMGKAPSPFNRIIGMRNYVGYYDTFITIEPILDFDLDTFVEMIVWASPTFVNIGADSKGHGLVEPTYDKIMALYEKLCENHIEVRKKINLDRLKKEL